MEQEHKEKIERLFVIKQKIKRLEDQEKELLKDLPDLSLTGDKITFPAGKDHPGFTVWQQTAKSTSFDQVKIHDAYWFAESTGDEKLFDITVKAATLKKIREGKANVDPTVADILLSSVVTKEGKASWRFKAEGEEDADEE